MKNKSKSTNKITKHPPQPLLSKEAPKKQLPSETISKSQEVIKTKITPPEPAPLTEQQIRRQQQKRQALNRIHLLQKTSQQSQNKKVKFDFTIFQSTLLLQNITQNVQKDIISSVIGITQQPQEISRFLQKKKDKQKEKQAKQLTQSQILDKEYRNLLWKKQMMIEELKVIEQNESLVRKQLTDSTLSPSRLKFNKMPELTEQTKQHWKKIRQMVKQHQIDSTRIYELTQLKRQQQQKIQQQLQDKRRQQRSEEKRKVLEKRINQIENRHKERTQHVKQSQNIVQTLQKKKKLFQKMQENWKRQQQQLKNQDESTFHQSNSNHARRKINMRELQKYQFEHDVKFQEQEQKRKVKLFESKVTHHRSVHSFHKTKFSVDVLQEAKQNKERQEEKVHQIKQLMNKKREYSTSLKQKFRAKSTLESHNKNKDRQIQQEKPTMKFEKMSITALDIRNKGNEYMRKINSNVASMKGRSQSKKQIPTVFTTKKEYKNYLPQVFKSITPRSQQKSYRKEVDMINTIMKKQNSSIEEKFFQAQIITKKIQSGGKQKDLLNSINAKIQILKKLSYNNI